MDTKIQLSETETAILLEFDNSVNAYVAGVQAMAQFARRIKLSEILAARKLDSPGQGQ